MQHVYAVWARINSCHPSSGPKNVRLSDVQRRATYSGGRVRTVGASHSKTSSPATINDRPWGLGVFVHPVTAPDRNRHQRKGDHQYNYPKTCQ